MAEKETTMRIPDKIVLSFVVALTITSVAAAQRRAVPAKPAATGAGDNGVL